MASINYLVSKDGSMRFHSVELRWPIGRPGKNWRARRKDARQVRSGAASVVVVVPRRLWVRVGSTERVGLVGTVHGGRLGAVVTTGFVPRAG